MQHPSEKTVLHLEVRSFVVVVHVWSFFRAIFLPPSESLIYYLNERNSRVQMKK